MSPTNGASNANDFQPTTQNPQTIPSNLFQQQGGVQTVTNTQELLNDQQTATISITRAPAPEAPVATKANESPIGFVIVVILLLVVVGIWFYRRRTLGSIEITSTETTPSDSPEIAQEASEEKSVATAKPKKPAAKKKSTKKAKRKRR